MAGTRLRIAVTFVVSLLIWWAVAIAWSGLLRDLAFQRFLQPNLEWILPQHSNLLPFPSVSHTKLLVQRQLDIVKTVLLQPIESVGNTTPSYALLFPSIPIVIGVSEGRVLFWQSMFRTASWADPNDSASKIAIQVIAVSAADENGHSACRRNATSPRKYASSSSAVYQKSRIPIDLWICEEADGAAPTAMSYTRDPTTTKRNNETLVGATSRIVFSEQKASNNTSSTTTTTLWYPTTHEHLDHWERILFPSSLYNSPNKPLQWQLILILDRSVEFWKDVTDQVNEWANPLVRRRQHRSSANQNWLGSCPLDNLLDFRVLRTDAYRSLVTRNATLDRKSSDYPVDFLSLPDAVAQSDGLFQTESSIGRNTAQIVLYVSSQDIRLVNTIDHQDGDDANIKRSTEALLANNRWLYIVSNDNPIAHMTGYFKKTMQATLDKVQDLITTECWGIPTHDDDAFALVESVMDTNVGSAVQVPSLCQRLFYSLSLSKLYLSVAARAEVVCNVLLSLPLTVSIPSDLVSSQLPEIIQSIAFARQNVLTAIASEASASSMASSSLDVFATCRQILLLADRQMMDILSDPALAEPLDFPPEQYAAIFAPLIVPLLVPLLATIVREYKRYRRLIKK